MTEFPVSFGHASSFLAMLLLAGDAALGAAASAAPAPTPARPRAAVVAGGQSSIVNSPHNLSATGPGAIRAASEQEICIFCHTPHNAAPVQPLWNRNVPVGSYRVYSSTSLKAKPSQPTGSSKLCLSCHDGTIALGRVFSRNQPIAMTGAVAVLPQGSRANLGTDLRGNHPISFRYDTQLVGKNPKLKGPAALPAATRLDAQQEMQCTTCHDAHNDSLGNFLVMDNSTSQLCSSCHIQGSTSVTRHQQCATCHQSHRAPSGAYLLRTSKVSETCLLCHSGGTTQPQGANIAADLRKFSIHDTNSAIDIPDPYPSNVTCADCHEPHTMKTTVALAPNTPPASAPWRECPGRAAWWRRPRLNTRSATTAMRKRSPCSRILRVRSCRRTSGCNSTRWPSLTIRWNRPARTRVSFPASSRG